MEGVAGMKRALVVVQGIHEELYAKNALKKSKLDIGQYNEIRFIDTEEVFDAWSPKIKWWDKFGDVVKFYLNVNRRKAVCRKVTKTVGQLQKVNYEVDILAHSLGTVITLCSKARNVRRLYLLGSPLSFGIPFAASYIRQHTRKYMKNFSCEEIFYIWSPKDFVCKHYKNVVAKLLAKTNPKTIVNIKSDSKHNLTDYIDDLVASPYL